MKLFRAALVAALMLVAFTPAYAGKMAKAKGPLVVDPGKATIVFMRPGSFVGRAIAVPVFDVTEEQAKYVGIVDAGGKVAYSVPAGEYTFMTTVAGGDAGVRFQKARVEAGKVYYFRAHIISGLWGLHPVRGSELNGDEFKDWEKSTTLLENSPKTLKWGEETLADAQRKSGLKPGEIAEEFTLHAEDGR
jgi:hypothetical protein